MNSCLKDGAPSSGVIDKDSILIFLFFPFPSEQQRERLLREGRESILSQAKLRRSSPQ